MLTQVAVEALNSATYVTNYLDSVENLPDDIQRYLSRIREIDVQYRSYLRDVDLYYEQWQNETDPSSNANKRAIIRMQQNLIAAQELGDEKLQIVQQLQDLIDHKTRQLDQNLKDLDYTKDEKIMEIQNQKELPAHSPPVTSPTNVNLNQVFSPISSSATTSIVTSTVSSQSAASVSTSCTNNSSGYISGSNSNTASNTTSNERSRVERFAPTKRSRRARNDTGSGNGGNGSTTPMEVDPIDISSIKVENQQSSKQSSGTQNNNSNQTSGAGSSTGAGAGGTGSGKKGAGTKKKKRKTGGRQGNQGAREAREDTPPQEEAIDPDEPTYCLCDQISFGEMILCDNDLCPIEWFHFSCVALMSKPKGKWFCPNCRGERPNVMKPKAQFLKELERYNKEKEEKT
uniref:Inhibitor of growth protein n=1 Tax=Corethrella appendiculata TaxID=1370023 RepID=U5EQC4_9DIPT